ncbi:hypothetical protein psal_cds_1259 [Pandoravirus salinus]|uniref:Uncharacterized protein n=1 Tax=Pandoravirus salinus TaxID=1349410 RepID=S4W5G9_9VIRU|nr:hypothetical protein psal_cds_1259 [Pandoravirus salinus]AGO85600.2 hypothetical protein psal_cds_1259 [Pandoravirus salinus]
MRHLWAIASLADDARWPAKNSVWLSFSRQEESDGCAKEGTDGRVFFSSRIPTCRSRVDSTRAISAGQRLSDRLKIED